MGDHVELPRGVVRRPFVMHRDPRGHLAELFRDEWGVGFHPVQWNLVRSEPRVLRGVHVHANHVDYLSILSGRALVGLKDLRRGSPTEGLACMLPMSGDPVSALVIPPGVAHGFYYLEASMHVYAVSRTFDPADELGCRYDDPGLGLAWPEGPMLLSPRDEEAPSLPVLMEILAPHQPFGGAARG